MIATIPPLWRDTDAYLQLTVHPLITTFWGHGPAYCYLAKIPLFLGALLERVPDVAAAGNSSPPLTDTGVWFLIVLQHLALGGAAFYFIRSITRSFWIGLILALFWASNAFFYTFAHCTGSETLSLIALVLLVGKGFRLLRSRGALRWTDWYLFASALLLCLLARYVNLLLIFLLPVALLLSWAQSRLTSRFAADERERRRRRLVGSRRIGQAAIALAIGVASVAVANSLTHYLARKTKYHPHSRVGHTLMWRLQFLKTLPPQERSALLQKVTARSDSSDTRRLLALLAQMHDENMEAVGGIFMQRAAALLYPGEAQVPWEKLDLAVNEMAYAFLFPPTSEHWQVARADFTAALAMSLPEIPEQLFQTTAYFFDHKETMPLCAKLVTFRDTTAEALKRIPSERAYFRLYQGLNYKKGITVWAAILLVFGIVARWRKVGAGAIAAFAIALVIFGLAMVASACLLTEFLPRYGMPMWLLLLLSFFILIGTASHLLVPARKGPPGSCRG